MLFFFEHHGMEGKDLYQVNELHSLSFPAHLHRAYELIVVDAGTLSLQVEQKQYHMREGELAFLFCNQIHSFSIPEGASITVVLFSPEIIGHFYSAYKHRVPVNNVLRPKEPLAFYAAQSVYSQKALLYRVCDELLAATEMEQTDSRSQVAILQQIFAYVDKHFDGSCSLQAVAKSIQYDYAYLSKLFSRLTGMHFTEYLNHYRIAQACYLLTSGRQGVSEIAAHCGYATLRTFHRNFRMVMGCSPREYSQAGHG